MNLDLALLSTRFSQARPERPVSTEGVNPYLLEHILFPSMNGKSVCFRDIDYEAFELEDVQQLEEYYNKLMAAGQRLYQMIAVIQALTPEAQTVRAFC